MNIYAGNLADETTEEELNEAFGAFGQVSSAKIITDKYTGASRGFGFVTFETSENAQAAQEAMHGQELEGRQLRVDFANSKPR